MTLTSSTEEPSRADETSRVVEPQMMCEACARMVLAGTEWHSLSSGFFDRGECSYAKQGPGYWVCADCHEIIHEWMARNPDAAHPAKEGLQRIFKGLAQIIEDPPRKYQRSASPASPESAATPDRSENSAENQGPPSGDHDDTNT